MNFSTKYFITLILSFIVIFVFTLGRIEWYECLSVAICITQVLKFIDDLGKNISIKNTIAFIATLQWLLGPVLGYYYNDLIYFNYRMSIPKEVYFGYVLPATILFLVGLYSNKEKRVNMQFLRSLNIDYFRKGSFFIIFGFFARFIPIAFLSYLLSGLMFVGVFYMFASTNKTKYYWIAFVFGNLIIYSIGSGFFHELLLWGSFFLMIYFLAYPKKYIVRLLIILTAFGFAYLIQLAKSDYRELLWSGQLEQSSKIGAFIATIDKKVNAPDDMAETQFGNIIVRLNQGWIIAKVMDNIPSREPFAEGATVKNAIIASIFPRIVNPNKAIAGGHSNMQRFAGVDLNAGTSMDISQVGEAYANFGTTGGIIFMLLLGLFFNWIIKFITRWSNNYPDLIFWIPLIFLQVVKAETSLVTVLNHLTKALLVTWFFFSPWGTFFINSQFLKKQKGGGAIN